MPELGDIIKEIGTSFEEYKSANDLNLKKRDGVTDEKLARIDANLSALTEAKAAIEASLKAANDRNDELEKKMNRPGFGHNSGAAADEIKALADFNVAIKTHALANNRRAPEEVDADGYGLYRKGFNKYMREGDRGFDAAEYKAMSVGSDPDGGYLVLPDTSGRIITRVFETTAMRQLADVQVIGTDALEGIIDTDEAAFGGWVGESSARGNTGTPQINKWRIPVFEMFANPYATQQLLDDANVDVETWLANKVSDKLSRIEATAFITGTGQDQPKGLTSYATAATADATRAWGTFEHKATGVSADFAASSPADILFDLIGAFKNAYLANAQFLTRREVIAKIRKFKESTTNAYMWQPGLQKGQPDSLLGYPITNSQDMPTLAGSSLSFAFGDFKQAYQIVDRQGFRTIRDNLTNKPFVQFYTTHRVGGAAVQFECVKFIKFI